MTIDELQAQLRRAHAQIGYTGRFSFTINQSPNAGMVCYVTHWFRPTPYAFEDCRDVGKGNLAACLAGLERYVHEFPRNFPEAAGQQECMQGCLHASMQAAE